MKQTLEGHESGLKNNKVYFESRKQEFQRCIVGRNKSRKL